MESGELQVGGRGFESLLAHQNPSAFLLYRLSDILQIPSRLNSSAAADLTDSPIHQELAERRYSFPRESAQVGYTATADRHPNGHMGCSCRSSTMIAVTGATGRTGRRIAEILLAKGEKVRAIGRDAKKLAPLAESGAEPFVGDVEDVPA